MKTNLPIVPIVWDVDLTITEEYQQIPLFKKYFAKLQKKVESKGFECNKPDDYWAYANRSEANDGFGYLQQLIWDSRVGEPFDGLRNDELFELGREVKMAPGFKEALLQLRKNFEGQCEIHHFLVSVGITKMIEGIVDEQRIKSYVKGIAASEFLEHRGRIAGIKEAVLPFTKNEMVISFMKGGKKLLNTPMATADYKYDYRNMIVIGDGFTDTSKFAYAKKQGGTPIVVYKDGDEKEFAKAYQSVSKWADYVLPRNYTPGGITFKLLSQAITKKLSVKKPFHAQLLHDFKKGKIHHRKTLQLIKEELLKKENQDFFHSTIVHPSGRIEETCVYKIS